MKLDVQYVPSPPEVVEAMLDLADLRPGDVLYDLGCGDGRIVIAAARRGALAYGFDLDPERVKEAQANIDASGGLCAVKEYDLFALSLASAEVVTLYLSCQVNARLIPQLAGMKPGTRIVSHDFAIEGMTPTREISVKLLGSDKSRAHPVYLWRLGHS